MIRGVEFILPPVLEYAFAAWPGCQVQLVDIVGVVWEVCPSSANAIMGSLADFVPLAGGGMYSMSISFNLSRSLWISSFSILAWETLGLPFRAEAEALFCWLLSGASLTDGGGGGRLKALVFAFVVLRPKGARFRGPIYHHD